MSFSFKIGDKEIEIDLPFEDEEDRRFVPVPEAVKTDMPFSYGPGPVDFDPFEGEKIAPPREVAPEQVRGLRPPQRQPEQKAPWLEKPIEPILGTTAEEALMVPLQVLRGTQELAAGVGAGIQWLGNRLDNKIIKEAGQKLGDYYRKEAERIGQPKSIVGKNVFDSRSPGRILPLSRIQLCRFDVSECFVYGNNSPLLSAID